MFLQNRLLLLFFFFGIWRFAIVDEVQAQKASNTLPYSTFSPSSPALVTVGSSVTTDKASSWVSSSGRFSFGFYQEKDVFSVGIQFFASPSETVVVWTARPDLNRFSKGSFLNFTEKGIFVISEKGVKVFRLFNFSSTATSASMLNNGNFVVYDSEISKKSTRTVVGTAKPGQGYTNNRCVTINKCRPGADNSDTNLDSYSDTNSDSYSDSSTIWRSFDFPTDTILGSQFLPCDHNFTSSAGKNDHSIGKYIINLPCGGDRLISYGLNSANKYWDTEASDGNYTSLNLDEDGRLYLISSGGEDKYLSDHKPTTDDNIIYRATLDSDDTFRLYAHNLNINSTTVDKEIPLYTDKCQNKSFCGVNSYCLLANGNAECHCMPGFDYINPDSHTGCRRNETVPSCFNLSNAAISMEKVENIVGMDDLAYGVVSTTSLDDCSNACLSDCNCDAASFIDQACLKLKLPLTSARKDDKYSSVAFIKLARLAPAQQRRKVRFAAIFISAAVTISIWIVVIVAFIGAYWFLLGRFREEWRKWEVALTEEIVPRYFSYQELIKGSDEFKHQLGKGGHGTVFRANLPIGDNTVAVAVKKLHGAEMEGEREFQAEMRFIGRACHANLVRLLGFCHDGPSRLIVYELMSRGSLANHIFESRGRRLRWERRVAILLAAARGIHYLHCECETKIIHRDIKPENILIAEDWMAKIADFGLAKLLNKNQTRAATRTLAAGTEGYVAPECEREEVDGTGEALVSEKADVYSYGIVVLETICGRRNREGYALRKLTLCELVRESYEANELWKLVDGEEVEAPELEKLVKIGLLCVQEDPNARPVMDDVVMMLEGYIDVPTPLPFSSSL